MSSPKSSRIPSYRRHKTRGRAVVTLDGRDYYLGAWNSAASRQEYHRLIGEWLAAGGRMPRAADALTVTELCAAYWRFAQTYYVGGGQLDNVQRMIRTLRQLYGAQPAAKFGPLALKAVRQGFIDDKLARSYVNKLADLVRRIFKWGASEELVPAETWHALQTVGGLRRGKTEAREAPPVEPVADAVVEATLPHLPPVVVDMVRLQRLTGARPDEVCSLRPADVDRTGEVWAYRPARHKTQHHGRQRVIFIGPKGQALLRPYLLREAEAFCFSPAEADARRRAELHAARKTPLSCGNRPGSNRTKDGKRKPGERYTANTYRRAVHRACTLADEAARKAEAKAIERGEQSEATPADVRLVPQWSPNQLRHAVATEVRRAFGLESAQHVLGHAKANMTEIYAERDLSKAEAVMKAIG